MSRQLNRCLETLNCNVSVHCSSHWHGLTDDDGGGGGGDDDDDINVGHCEASNCKSS